MKRDVMMFDSKVKRAGLYACPQVGRTGLCNMLFPWARAFVYSQKMNCMMMAPRWTSYLRLGPLLRRERDKRYYRNQLMSDGYVSGFHKLVACFRNRADFYKETDADVYKLSKGVVLFAGLGKYFYDIQDYRESIKVELLRIVNPLILKSMAGLPSKFVGVHVRAGDFVTTGQNLSLDYYVKAIDAARDIVADSCEILVFSDARSGELERLEKMNGVRIMPPACAVQDLLALSRATMLVGTNHSSFSEWAVFLGGMRSIWSRDGRPPCNLFDNTFV